MKRAALVIAGVLLIGIIAAGVWAFPLFKAANILNKAPALNKFDFELSIELNDERLSLEQQKFVNVLSWLLGKETGELMAVRAVGSFYEQSAYADIYLGETKQAVSRVYICDNEVYINVKMLYEAIHNNISGSYPLLEAFIPDWGYEEYITLEQIEEIFCVELKGLFNTDYPFFEEKASFWQYLMLLLKMDRNKGENGELRFELKNSEYSCLFEITEDNNFPIVNMEGISNVKGQPIETIEAEIVFDNTDKITQPESIMNQPAVDGFAKLWSVISKLGNKAGAF